MGVEMEWKAILNTFHLNEPLKAISCVKVAISRVHNRRTINVCCVYEMTIIIPPFMHFRFNYVDRPVCTSSNNKAPLDLSLSPKMLIPLRITVHRRL